MVAMKDFTEANYGWHGSQAGQGGSLAREWLGEEHDQMTDQMDLPSDLFDVPPDQKDDQVLQRALV